MNSMRSVYGRHAYLPHECEWSPGQSSAKGSLNWDIGSCEVNPDRRHPDPCTCTTPSGLSRTARQVQAVEKQRQTQAPDTLLSYISLASSFLSPCSLEPPISLFDCAPTPGPTNNSLISCKPSNSLIEHTSSHLIMVSLHETLNLRLNVLLTCPQASVGESTVVSNIANVSTDSSPLHHSRQFSDLVATVSEVHEVGPKGQGPGRIHLD